MSAAYITVLLVFGIFFFLFKEGLGFLQDPGLGELAGTRWNPTSFFNKAYGILPLLSGTLLVGGLAMLFALPFGILGAIYLSEVASSREREILKPFIELLASFPPVILGFLGMITIVPAVKGFFNLDSGLNALSGAILLAIAALPTIISISEDALRNVPSTYKQASLALGASGVQTIIRVICPAGLSGVIAAVMLGVARAMSETIAVMMVVGNSPILTLSPFESVRTMTVTIASEMGEVPVGSTHYSALFWVGIVLLTLTFIFVTLSHRYLKKYELS
jgi:phosphate transport system permease protein